MYLTCGKLTPILIAMVAKATCFSPLFLKEINSPCTLLVKGNGIFQAHAS